MNERWRVVIDSNVLVSSLIVQNSTPGKATEKAIGTAKLLASKHSLVELASVLSRRKFDRYATIERRQQFLTLIRSVSELTPVACSINICRDPKDNMILELAVSGNADLIITGDQDLLSLVTFQSISIITPAQYLQIS